jgi:hypothetical protein
MKELSEAIQVYDRMAQRFAKFAIAAHIERAVTPPVSKMIAWIHGGSLVVGAASIAYACYVFSKKNHSTGETVSAALGLIMLPLNVFDIMSLHRFYKERKEQKTAAETKSIHPIA